MQIRQESKGLMDSLLHKKEYMQKTTQAVNEALSDKRQPLDRYDLAMQDVSMVMQNMMKLY